MGSTAHRRIKLVGGMALLSGVPICCNQKDVHNKGAGLWQLNKFQVGVDFFLTLPFLFSMRLITSEIKYGVRYVSLGNIRPVRYGLIITVTTRMYVGFGARDMYFVLPVIGYSISEVKAGKRTGEDILLQKKQDED